MTQVTRRFDTNPWRLSWPLLAVTACGPDIAGGEWGAEGSETSQSTDTTGGPDCSENAQCPPGYACFEGICVYEGGCGHVRPDGDRFRCPGPQYDCYDDSECYTGVCINGFCQEPPPPGDCDALPTFAEPLSLTFTDPGETQKVFFPRTATTGSPLVAIRGDRVVLPGVDTETMLVTETGAILDAIGFDADGDGDFDLVTATAGETPTLTAWRQDDGVFVAVPGPALGEPAAELGAGDWDGDSVVDLFVRTDAAIYIASGVGDGSFGPLAASGTPASRMVVADVNLDGVVELLLGREGGFELLLAVDGTSLPISGVVGDWPAALVGDFTGSSDPDLVGFDTDALVTWTGPLTAGPDGDLASSVNLATSGAVGSLGGTDRDDAVVAFPTSGDATILFGGEGNPYDPLVPFACSMTLPVGFFASSLAIGDFDDDGSNDIVATNGAMLYVYVQE